MLQVFTYVTQVSPSHFLVPDDPHQKNHGIEQCLEEVVVEEVKLIREGELYKGKSHDTEEVGEVYHEDAHGYVPELVFPRAGEKGHDHDPVHPLLQGGAIGHYRHKALHVVGIDGLIDQHHIHPHGLQHPHALPEHPAGHGLEQPKYRALNRPKPQPLRPAQVNEVKPEQQGEE